MTIKLLTVLDSLYIFVSPDLYLNLYIKPYTVPLIFSCLKEGRSSLKGGDDCEVGKDMLTKFLLIFNSTILRLLTSLIIIKRKWVVDQFAIIVAYNIHEAPCSALHAPT